jgi:uncharacterized repeat protein (TIGR01451 family)
MKFEFYAVAALALLLVGPVHGGRSGGLRKTQQVRVPFHHVFAVVFFEGFSSFGSPLRLLHFLFKQAEPSRAVQAHRKLSRKDPNPIQTFYVPLPEEDLFKLTFEAINSNNASPPITSLISFAISTTGTVIWYDHWEDGYEEDATNPLKSTTQVWGDGDISNGCAPNVVACNDDSDDVFVAGDSVVIQNDVELDLDASPSRNPDQIRYDGGDRIQASFPIAVTRGAYPERPGSLMAGGVEVLDTSLWGKNFIAPVGEDISFETQAFEYTGLYVMAGEDDTKIYIKGSTDPVTLSQGESIHVNVDQGDIITSNKNVQVDLCTGDVGSTYELRWYSLRATDDWADKYLSPVGDTEGETKVVLYNPSGGGTIKVKVTTLDWKKTYSISPGSSKTTDYIKTGSGALFEEKSNSGKPFIALSVTDTVYNGQLFDWGFPIVAVRDLTPQVLIGWGFGCTDNNCKEENYNNKNTRSVVWVTPVEDATFYVDYNNNGTVDGTFEVDYLESQIIHDDTDKDMSGAVIYATKRGEGSTGASVNFAAAWGQDPDRSGSNDESALDLGTLVVPFNGFQASKIVALVDDNDNDGNISPGDKIKYTIVVSNVGQNDVPVGGVTVKDTLDPDVTFVADSMQYSVPETGDFVPISGAAFPLAGDGINSKFKFLKRGGTHEISFEVTINDAATVTKDTIFNTGTVTFGSGGGGFAPFTLNIRLGFSASAEIDIDKSVYLGQRGPSACNGASLLVGEVGNDVTYCFKVTNNGSSYLNNVAVTDKDLKFNPECVENIGMLAPGETKTVIMETTMEDDFTSDAEATGAPVYANTQMRLPGVDVVKAMDYAGVELTAFPDDEEICE